MMTSKKKNESGLSVKGQRYWSLMLVGEHGRVIPFRRFKEVAIAIFAIALLSFAALIVLGFFYVRQGRTIEELQSQLAELKTYAGRLKDEKDVLNARLGIKKAQMTPRLETNSKAGEEKSEAQDVKPAAESRTAEQTNSTAGVSASSKEAQEPKTEKPKPPAVEWGADIQQLSVDYDNERNILRAKFRVYNRSVPKQKLAGRTVVVFKNKADPPIKWFAVPNVLLSNGQPNGKVGQAFNINNYITMRHHAYGMKTPQKYDAAAVFVFSAQGELLASREFDFKIEPPPPPKPKPAPEPREEAPVNSSTGASEDERSTVSDGGQISSEKESETGLVRDGNATETEAADPVGQGTQAADTSTVSTDSAAAEAAGGNETILNDAVAPASEKTKPIP